MNNKGLISHQLIVVTGGLLLLATIVWLSWPQTLPITDLTLAGSLSSLDNRAPEESGQRAMPQVNTEALGKQGDLAFVSQGLLYVAEGDSGSARALTDSGRATAPAWSHDGEWLAFIRVTAADTDRGPLWLVRRDGSAAHEVQGLPETLWDWSFSWSPTTNQLVVAVHGYGLWLVPTTGQPEQLDPAPWLYRAAWSPDGRYLAYNFCLSGDTPRDDGDHDILCVMDVERRQRFDLVQTDNAGVRLLGWWPDGQGILYWEVPAHGGSVATDGIMIQSVPLAYTQANGSPIITAANTDPVGTMLKRANANSPQPVELVITLPKPHWAKFTANGKLLAVEGGGRIAWTNKHLALIDLKSGKSEQLVGPRGRVMLDPDSSTTDGRIAFVAAPDLGDTWGLTEAEFADWKAKRTLWVRGNKGQLHELTQAGDDIYGPTWSADGTQIRYFSHNALWTIAADNQSAPQQIVDLGPCEGKGIYGSIDYNAYFDWHER